MALGLLKTGRVRVRVAVSDVDIHTVAGRDTGTEASAGSKWLGLRVFHLRVFHLRVFHLRVFNLRVFNLRVFGLVLGSGSCVGGVMVMSGLPLVLGSGSGCGK